MTTPSTSAEDSVAVGSNYRTADRCFTVIFFTYIIGVGIWGMVSSGMKDELSEALSAKFSKPETAAASPVRMRVEPEPVPTIQPEVATSDTENVSPQYYY